MRYAYTATFEVRGFVEADDADDARDIAGDEAWDAVGVGSAKVEWDCYVEASAE